MALSIEICPVYHRKHIENLSLFEKASDYARRSPMVHPISDPSPCLKLLRRRLFLHSVNFPDTKQSVPSIPPLDLFNFVNHARIQRCRLNKIRCHLYDIPIPPCHWNGISNQRYHLSHSPSQCCRLSTNPQVCKSFYSLHKTFLRHL